MSFTFRLFGTTNAGEVDSSGQQRVIPYDAGGNVIMPEGRAAVSDGIGGEMLAGKDYKLSRTLRASSCGTLRTDDDQLMFFDYFEGTTRNLNKWIETATTMTSAQAVATALTLNSGSSVATNVGILESSHRKFPIIPRGALIYQARLRNVAFNNSVAEWGFSDQASATTAGHSNGAFFRKDASGSLQPVLAFNGTETQGTVFSAPANTDYYTYEIFLEDTRATFQIIGPTGSLFGYQVMEIGSSAGGGGSLTQARMFAVTHLPCFMRVYNTGSAPSTAPQTLISAVAVSMVDVLSQREYAYQQIGMGMDSSISPTAFTQLANWGNSAAPTTRTLSNTAAAETTLGGLLRVNSIAGGNTDLIMFAWTNPSPYTFFCTGIWIPVPMNEVVAVATTATIFAYFAAFNSSGDSLATAAPYSPMRVALPGIHTAAVGLAANTLFSGNNVQANFQTPFPVQPGRRLHIGCRELVGTATATETYLWAGVGVTGFFE